VSERDPAEVVREALVATCEPLDRAARSGGIETIPADQIEAILAQVRDGLVALASLVAEVERLREGSAAALRQIDGYFDASGVEPFDDNCTEEEITVEVARVAAARSELRFALEPLPLREGEEA
jgi:Cdc6-like AAA superfamily ATPase